MSMSNSSSFQNKTSSIPKSIRSHSILADSNAQLTPSNLPLAARTRSMTRLSLVAQPKLHLIDRQTGKISEHAQDKQGQETKSPASAPRRVLGEKTMNIHHNRRSMEGRPEGLKRKSTIVTADGKVKRMRMGEILSVRRDEERAPLERIQPPNSEGPPATPSKSVTASANSSSSTIPRPTPARVILRTASARPSDASAESGPVEDEVSPELSSRFIARPPTPPRPHMTLSTTQPSTAPPHTHQATTTPTKHKPDGNDMDIDDSNGAPSTPPKQPTTPSLSLSFQKISLAPQTPSSTAVTPKRVMASVSKFRSGPSPKAGSTPTKVPSTSGPRSTLDSVMEQRAENMRQTTLTGMVRRTTTISLASRASKRKESSPASASQDLDMDVAISDSTRTIATQVDLQTPAEDKQVPLRPTPSKPTVEPKLSIMPLPLPKSNRAMTAAGETMPPPTRIPSAFRAARVANTTAQGEPPKKVSGASSSSRIPAPAYPLGRGFPPSQDAISSSSSPFVPDGFAPVRRKPSYPSSLGSGPLARPRDRMVSGPTLYHQRDGSLASQRDEQQIPQPKQSPRSVSEPVARPRPSSLASSLSSSTSRREGLSSETARSLAGLSDALNKLKKKDKVETTSTSEPHRPRTGVLDSQNKSMSMSLGPRRMPSTLSTAGDPGSSSMMLSSSTSTSVRVSSVHRPRQSIVPGDVSMDTDSGHAGDRSLAAIMCSTDGQGCLKGVVAFVDVRTADGDDATPIFTEMLRSLGARVLSRLTESVTHIVYKSGKPTTLTWYRKQEEGERPHIVGISWVTRCKAKGERLDEGDFVVNVGDEDIFQKRRKSMEPKALANSANQMTLDSSLNIAAIRRKSLMYAPKISSPLKTAYMRPHHMDEE